MPTTVSSSDCLAERRKRLRQTPNVIGLDFVEVCRRSATAATGTDERTFRLHFLGVTPRWLSDDAIQMCELGCDKKITVNVCEADSRRTRPHTIEFKVDDKDKGKLVPEAQYSITIQNMADALYVGPTTAGSGTRAAGYYVASEEFNGHATYQQHFGDCAIWHDGKRWIISHEVGSHSGEHWTGTKQLVGPYRHSSGRPDPRPYDPRTSGTPKNLDLAATAVTIDPFFECVTFTFMPAVEAKADCVSKENLPSASVDGPDINYLAKDYATFRQLMLDRLSVTMPDWRDRSPADIGVMLVELLAYAADHLSYYQDAVATEAYLGTARLRQSLRRHARLVDYRVHEGCNARTWVHLNVASDVTLQNAKDLFFVTKPSTSQPLPTTGLTSASLEHLLRTHRGCEVFEPVVSKTFTFRSSHNVCRLHDWGGATPCLPSGATSAFLVNEIGPDKEKLHFGPGDIVIFEEVASPWTGVDADADPHHRHAVRITQVDEEQHDDLFVENDKARRLPLMKITWSEADALPFTVWITKPFNASWDRRASIDLTVVRGNVLLVDHGRTFVGEKVNLSKTWETPEGSAHYPAASVKAELFAPNLTFSDDLPSSGSPAAAQLLQTAHRAKPQVLLQPVKNSKAIIREFSLLELRDLRRLIKRMLESTLGNSAFTNSYRYAKQFQHACGCGNEANSQVVELGNLRSVLKDDLRNVWLPVYDLIDSGPDDARFVVEMSDDRRANLRFGQRGFGRTPDLNGSPWLAEMVADYRIGNGVAGNVPSEAIQMVGSYSAPIPEIESVRNLLPAVGGVDPQPTEEIRLFAPHEIRTDLRRAITAEDYEQITMREFGNVLQRAKVTFVWTGHEYEVLVAVDPKGREVATEELLQKIRRTLHLYRRIGHSVRVRAAERVVPVLALNVCVATHVIKEQAEGELHRLFSNQVLADGSLAFFHPDQLTFGEGIFVSQLVAAATQRLGDRLLHIEVVELHRSDEGPASELEDGLLPLRPQEIVRFDNNREHREFGDLKLYIKGGR